MKTRETRRVIQNAPPSIISAPNPYLAILRRDYPEPFIALLAFVLGIWLWDHYFGKNEGYPPGTEEIALIKIDRDLRLADAMNQDPRWLKWLAGAEDPHTARQHALAVFDNLAKENAVTFKGLEALAIIKAEHDHLPVGDVLASVMQGQMLSEFAETSQNLAHNKGTWWHAKLIEAWEQNMQPAQLWRQSFGLASNQLRTRAIAVRSSIWLIGLVGLACIPACLKNLKNGLHAKPRGYGGAWPLPLGLVVFLAATLAWIGFTMTLEIGISTLPNIHPAVGIFLDSTARMLPPLIALGLLFRRPSHAIRVLGLRGPIAFKSILGLFSLLMIIDQVLRSTIGTQIESEPGGGLSLADAGLWGLAFAIISACLLAPFAEEILYRGILFRSFWNRLGVIPAAILSSIIFAALHFYDGYGLASVGVFGLSCALLYAATGSLTSSIALHVLYNSAIKIPEWIIYHGSLG